jgi:hypothetical protein
MKRQFVSPHWAFSSERLHHVRTLINIEDDDERVYNITTRNANIGLVHGSRLIIY